MSIGPRTQPRQLRPSVVTAEDIEHGEARAQGTYDVVVPGAVWPQRPAFGDLETEIEQAIRGVLERVRAAMMRRLRRWLGRWGDVVMPFVFFLIGAGMFLSQGLYSFWGPVGAATAVIALVMGIQEVLSPNRKRRRKQERTR